MLHGFYSAEAFTQQQGAAAVAPSTATGSRYDLPPHLSLPGQVLMARNAYYNATEAELHEVIALQDPVIVFNFLEAWCRDLIRQLNDTQVRLLRLSALQRSFGS